RQPARGVDDRCVCTSRAQRADSTDTEFLGIVRRRIELECGGVSSGSPTGSIRRAIGVSKENNSCYRTASLAPHSACEIALRQQCRLAVRATSVSCSTVLRHADAWAEGPDGATAVAQRRDRFANGLTEGDEQVVVLDPVTPRELGAQGHFGGV